jgi:hypothetical protein
MELLDPATGRPLPADAIQRILFIHNTTHVYNIPPLASNRGHLAASWTADPARQIFTARLRVVETSTDSPSSIKVDVVLEDKATGQLFAAAPYTAPASVEPVTDSSRFFAIAVRDDQGRKAVLGIGFEDRSEAFDFGVALQEARKSLGWDNNNSGAGGSSQKDQSKAKADAAPPKDYSLKEGETITVNLGGAGIGRRRNAQQQSSSSTAEAAPANLQSFALAPPPGPGGSSSPSGGFSLAPPPSAQEVRQKKRMSAQDLGFDDGQFGEFA